MTAKLNSSAIAQRPCGSTGLKLSALGLGCWAFGGGEYWGAQDQQDVDAVVRQAIDWGVTYLDTAEAYNEGRSETALGQAIRGLRRDSFVLGTKVSPVNCYPDKLVQSCEASLKRLGVDYVDLYMIHWPIHSHSLRHYTKDEGLIANPPRLGEALETLRRLRAQGKIRQVGVSNFGVARLDEALEIFPDLATNELPCNLLMRALEYEILPHCQQRNVGVIGYMTLLQGLLTDNYPTLREVPDWRRRTRHFDSRGCQLCRHGESGAEAQTDAALANIREVMKETGLSMADLAVKWALAKPGLTCALVGARNIRQLEANVRSGGEALSPDVVAALDRATDELKAALGPGLDYYENTALDRTK